MDISCRFPHIPCPLKKKWVDIIWGPLNSRHFYQFPTVPHRQQLFVVDETLSGPSADRWIQESTCLSLSAQAHEFRFYNDITVNWEAILDIAATAHEYNMARFHRPGSWAFMDMLEVGVDFRGVPQTNGAFLTFAESRSHFALWVIMAQPLHLGLDIRNVSADLLDLIGNEEVLALHADPLGAMGYRAAMSDGRANGTQVWARTLSDGSRLIGLLNAGWGAGNWSAENNCTWQVKHGGYFQGKAGNWACWPRATLAEMQSACCAAGTAACASLNTPSSTHIGGCAKRDNDGGWVNGTGEDDFVIVKGHKEPVPPPPRRICVSWGEVGLNPREALFVRDLWGRRNLGQFAGEFCMDVGGHDTALLHVDSKESRRPQTVVMATSVTE